MRGILGIVVGAALVLCAPAEAQQAAAQKTVVVLGVSGRPDQAGLELALRRGYFERQGLEIHTVQASGGPEFVSSLATDQIQVASGSPNPGLFNALNRGINIRLVADFAHFGDDKDRTLSLMVRADLWDSGTVRRPADLKGRSLSIGPGGPGQVPDVLFNRIFDPLGMTRADLDVKYINFSDAMVALSTKAVDSAFQIEPLVTLAEVRDIARVLVPGGAVFPGGELSIVYYSPAFAQNSEVATKFMIGYLQGVRDCYDAFFQNKDKDATIALLVETLSMKDKKIWENWRQFTDLNGRVNVENLKYQASVYKQLGMITGAVPDIDAFVDMRFAEAAVKAIGPR